LLDTPTDTCYSDGMTRRGAILWGVGVAAGLLAGMLLDAPGYRLFRDFGKQHHSALSEWLKLTWLFGFLPFWLLVACGVGCAGSGANAARLKREAWGLVAAVVASGLLGNVLKILIRRERPHSGATGYTFRPWADQPFSDGGLGLPSGHVCLAFAGAWVLSRICPRARALWYVLAVLCAANRLLEGRHFLSDVWVGAFVGSLVAALVWRRVVGAGEASRSA